MAGQGKVLSSAGEDYTEAFLLGAEKVMALIQSFSITAAVLKEKSPSCGSHLVYDGTFSGKTIPGKGILATKLAAFGIPLFSEQTWGDFLQQEKEFSNQ